MDRVPPAEPNISSREDQRQFLKVIYEDFLRVVVPDSFFLDKLYAADLLTDTDLESVSGKDVPTRKEQARKIWILLNKISVDDFKATVYPALCQEYPHILPLEFPGQEMGQSRASMKTNCLRHDIMRRIRLHSWLDVLYLKNCLSFEDFENMVSNKGRQTEMWDKAFQSLKEHEQGLMRTELVGGIKSLLTKYKVNVPHDLENHVSRGIPCSCDQPVGNNVLPHFSAIPEREVNFWLKMKSQNKQYGSETSSTTSLQPGSSQNLSSVSCSTSSIPSNNNDLDSQSVISDTCQVPEFMTITCPNKAPNVQPSFDQTVLKMDKLSGEKSSEDGISERIKVGENDDEKMLLNSSLISSSSCMPWLCSRRSFKARSRPWQQC